MRRLGFASFVLVAALDPAFAQDPSARPPVERRPHDEFGLIPDDESDSELALPDPVLDRGWPGPKPGEDGRGPETIVPDEDADDPFLDETAPPPPVRKPPSGFAEEPPKPVRPAPPLVGPDGRIDEGSPAPAPDPALPEVLERDVPEPGEIEQDEMRPSPFDEDPGDNVLMDGESPDDGEE